MQTRTRDDVLAKIAKLNTEATMLTRRGRIGQFSSDYKRVHAELDALCVEFDELGTIDRPTDAHDAPRAHAASE